MQTINIKGKEYVPVVERVKEFHRLYPKADFQTEIVSNQDGRVIVKATVTIADETQRVFTGYSQAEWGKGMMGGVALEVAETSAVGRALGFANIGLIDGIATADEMRKVGEEKPSNLKKFMEDLVPTEEEVNSWEIKMNNAETLKELQSVWKSTPPLIQDKLKEHKDILKAKLGGK